MPVSKLDAVKEFIAANNLDIHTNVYTVSIWCYTSNSEHLGMVKAIATVLGLKVNDETSHTAPNEWIISITP